GREPGVVTDRCPPATDEPPGRSREPIEVAVPFSLIPHPSSFAGAARSATNEATGPASSVPWPGPLIGALALLALMLPVFAGHSARVEAGSDVGRAFRPDADRIGPDSVVGGGSVRRPVGSGRIGPGRVGGRSPLLHKTGSGRSGSSRTGPAHRRGPAGSIPDGPTSPRLPRFITSLIPCEIHEIRASRVQIPFVFVKQVQCGARRLPTIHRELQPTDHPTRLPSPQRRTSILVPAACPCRS